MFATVMYGLSACGGDGGDSGGAPLRQQLIQRMESTPEFADAGLTTAEMGCTADVMIKYVERDSLDRFLEGSVSSEELKFKPGVDHSAVRREGEKCNAGKRIIEGG